MADLRPRSAVHPQWSVESLVCVRGHDIALGFTAVQGCGIAHVLFISAKIYPQNECDPP